MYLSSCQNQFTPLSYAVIAGHKDICETLIGKGANVNLKTKYKWQCINKIIKGDNLTYKNKLSHLHLAVMNDHYDIAKLLLDKGATIDVGTTCL